MLVVQNVRTAINRNWPVSAPNMRLAIRSFCFISACSGFTQNVMQAFSKNFVDGFPRSLDGIFFSSCHCIIHTTVVFLAAVLLCLQR